MTRHKKLVIWISSISVVLVGVIVGIVLYLVNSAGRLVTYSDNTTIANAYIGGMNERDAREYLIRNASNWTTQATIKLSYQGYEISVDPSIFSINIPDSMRTIQNGKDNLLSVGLRTNQSSVIQDLLTENTEVLKYSDFDYDRLESLILSKVSLLYRTIEIDLGTFLSDLESNQSNLEDTLIDINEVRSDNLILNFQNLAPEIRVSGHSQFSLLKWYENVSSASSVFELTDEQLSFIATAMYELVLHTNFTMVDKEASLNVESFPSFATNRKGYEARISSLENLDFTFYNPNAMDYVFKLSRNPEGSGVVVSLHGAPFIFGYEITTTSSEMEPGVIYVVGTHTKQGVQIPQGGEAISAGDEGIPGFRTLVEREITYPNGQVIYEILNEDIYVAKPLIITRNNTTGN